MNVIKRLAGSLKNNLLLKIISVIIAVVIWYVVVGYNDPVETVSFNVRVTVVNESYIETGKQSYRIDDNYKTVTVYVQGNRSKLRDLTADDITVTADLTEIVDLSLDPIMVPLKASCSGFPSTDLTLSRQTIPIIIEVIANKTFPVTVSTADSSPGTNYEVGMLTPDPEQIGINGPETVINNIDSVVAEIDVTGMTRDGRRDAVIKLYDKSGAEMSAETIADDLTFETDIEEVTVDVDLWQKRTDVGFQVNYSGKPADGYHVFSVATTPETITVVGSDDALADLKAADDLIEIPAEMISVQNAAKDLSFSISLAELMPDGMRLAQNTADTLTVNVTVLSDESRELVLDVDDIQAEGLPEELTVSYDQAEFTIRVEGPGTVIDTLLPSDITASIDFTGLEEGDHALPVQFTLPTDISLLEDVTLSVHLRAKADSANAANGAAETEG